MANAELNVILSADGKQLSSTLKKGERDVLSFGKTTERLPASFNKFDTSLNKTSSALNKSKKDFTNLSRVIQDLPFGLIGIQNNLTQLIPGVGFLGLAFSGLITALTFSQVGLNNWIRSGKDAKDAAKDAGKETNALAEQQKRFAEAVDQAAASVISDAKNIKDLRDILISTNEATVRLTQSTINRGLAQFLFDEKNVELQKILNSEIQRSLTLRKQQSPFFDVTEFKKSETAVKNFNRTFQDFGVQLPGGFKAAKEVEDLSTSIGNAQDSIKGINVLSKGFEGFFKEFLSDGKKGKDVLDDLLQQVRQFETLINERGLRKVNFEIIPNEARNETIDRAREFIRNAIGRRFEFEINPKFLIDGIDIKPTQNYFEAQRRSAHKLFNDLQEEVTKLTKRNQILIAAETATRTERARGAELADSLGLRLEGINTPLSLLTKAQKEAVNTANTINAVLTPAFQNMFDAIQSGEAPIKAFFKGLGQAVTQLIQKLIAAALQALVISAIFPGLGGGKGGFGNIFKSLLGFRAEGGPVFAGKPYIVGEKGPELFVPQRGGQIVPNNEMNSGLSGITPGSLHITVEGKLRGRDINLGSARQGQFENRNI